MSDPAALSMKPASSLFSLDHTAGAEEQLVFLVSSSEPGTGPWGGYRAALSYRYHMLPLYCSSSSSGPGHGFHCDQAKQKSIIKQMRGASAFAK